MNHQVVTNHRYTIEQARLLLDVLKYHSGETLLPAFHQAKPQAIDEALAQLRRELTEFIETDDGLGLIVPSRDAKGLI